VFAAACIACASAPAGWAPVALRVNTSASAPVGLWAIWRDAELSTRRGAERAAASGEWVAVLGASATDAHPACASPRGGLLVKRVWAAPGGRVCRSGGAIGTAGDPRRSSDARAKLPAPDSCAEVPDQRAWIGTPHERSCASRAYRAIEARRLWGRATPLATWCPTEPTDTRGR